MIQFDFTKGVVGEILRFFPDHTLASDDQTVCALLVLGFKFSEANFDVDALIDEERVRRLEDDKRPECFTG